MAYIQTADLGGKKKEDEEKKTAGTTAGAFTPVAAYYNDFDNTIKAETRGAQGGNLKDRGTAGTVTQPASGGGYGGGTGAQAPAQLPNVGSDARVGPYAYGNYDPATDAAYQQALATLNAQKAQLPNYKGSYDADLASAYADITGRDPFSYDLDADMLYQQYRQQYVEGGQRAMMDTMGQAAALTGGYGSSYAQSVGQQQYDAYLQQLNDVVPQLYDRAYQQYRDEGDELLQRYSLARDLADTEYNQYRDQMSDYWTGVDMANQQEQLAYNRGLAANESEYERGLQANRDAYSRQQDEYNRVLGLMTNIGYTPSEEEMRAAGMTTAEASAWQNYIARQNTSRGGGGGNGYSDGFDTVANTLQQMASSGVSSAQINSALKDAFTSGLVNQDSYLALYNTYVSPKASSTKTAKAKK